MARKCFVLMPFAPEFDGVWEAVIRPTVQKCGDDCKRADDFYNPGPIMKNVLDSIQSADYLIADLTGRNANVFYELGQAHALQKAVISLTQSIADVPFDLRHLRIIEYQDTAAGAANLAQKLEQYIANL